MDIDRYAYWAWPYLLIYAFFESLLRAIHHRICLTCVHCTVEFNGVDAAVFVVFIGKYCIEMLMSETFFCFVLLFLFQST